MWTRRLRATSGIIALAVLTSACLSAGGPVDVATLGAGDLGPFASYLSQQGRPPAEYVISKFRDHDVVILGEMHEVPENLAFVAGLIDPLYRRAGVRCLATEFLRSRNTARANRIVTAPTYDEAAVVDLYRDFAWIWGYREYMDIFGAIWALNHSLPPGAERFRVAGLDTDVEESDVGRASPAQRPAVIRKIMARDGHMARGCEQAMAGGGKVLVHTGYMHSFTRYRQPIVAGGKMVREAPARMGAMLAGRYGSRIFQVCLHQWHFGPEFYTGGEPTMREPLGGLIERAMAAAGRGAVGFDVEGSPFADLRDARSCFFAFQPAVVFADIAQGYVVLKPLKDLGRRCTWVKGFVNASNFAKARAIALQRGWIRDDEGKTPAALDAKLGALLSSE